MVKFLSTIAFFLITGSASQVKAQLLEPYGPVPTRQQLQWHEMEFYLFIHFGPNTFTDAEWGHGKEDPNSFNPTEMDCRQWARIARDAGAKGIILTAKHHDGFSLWPSKQSKHTVKQSIWKEGKGNVVKELAAACREYGLKMGVYISPWDRNHPSYGTEKYNKVYLRTMKELLTGYGPLFELWWDGANGEGPNGKKQQYDFPRFEKAVRKWAPNTVIFSDIGPDIRWVGNERGIAAETNWNLLDTAGFKRGLGAPPADTLQQGNIHGKNWIPAECDVSIRPGWFYHQKEDSLVKSGDKLLDLYLKSVGRGATFLLNVPPDRRGLFHPNDSAALMDFKAKKDSLFNNNIAVRGDIIVSASRPGYLPQVLNDNSRTSHWAPPSGQDTVTIELDLRQQRNFNTIVLQEYIELGQRIKKFTVEVSTGDDFREVASGTTVGFKRIIQFPMQAASRVRIIINDSKEVPVLSEIALYNSEE